MEGKVVNINRTRPFLFFLYLNANHPTTHTFYPIRIPVCHWVGPGLPRFASKTKLPSNAARRHGHHQWQWQYC